MSSRRANELVMEVIQGECWSGVKDRRVDLAAQMFPKRVTRSRPTAEWSI
jgi:hypothetical protein